MLPPKEVKNGAGSKRRAKSEQLQTSKDARLPTRGVPPGHGGHRRRPSRSQHCGPSQGQAVGAGGSRQDDS